MGFERSQKVLQALKKGGIKIGPTVRGKRNPEIERGVNDLFKKIEQAGKNAAQSKLRFKSF